MSRSNGKKFSTQTFRVPGASKASNIVFDVRCRTISGNRVEFFADVQLPTEHIFEKDANPNVVISRVMTRLSAQKHATWERYYMVVFHTDAATAGMFRPDENVTFKQLDVDEDDGTPLRLDDSIDLYFTVKELDIGTHETGEKCWREDEHSHVRAGLPDEDDIEYGRRGGSSALIPATPENRQALLTFELAFRQLAGRLRDLLSANSIQQTLQKVMTHQLNVLALPAPTEVSDAQKIRKKVAKRV